ncbi:hypothetical protein [Actinoplanes subtropicus]|uniref:hypothetical protein n=1 Tax=Actinoplanes subtropicus TaxID=543632 RepID=UPI0004C3B662|nr:hypothetical protein [Actinoplanes subtropicus]
MGTVWTLASTDTADRVELWLVEGPPRPLMASLTTEEFERLRQVLRPVEDAVLRNEFSRPQLASICQDTIGRDPFNQEPAAPAEPSVWSDVVPVVSGTLIATGHQAWWVRLVGGAVLAYGLYGLAGRAWRHLRTS